MTDQQFDVSEKMKELFLRKREQRNELKAYFRKLVTNPHRSEGMVYDPLIQRYHAMSQYSVEFHKATPKNVAAYLGFLFVPIGGLSCLIWYRLQQKEKLYRSGVVPYKDRCRLIY